MSFMQQLSLSDIFVWPDGVWCYRDESHGMHHKSDDYQVLYADSPEWLEFVKENV